MKNVCFNVVLLDESTIEGQVNLFKKAFTLNQDFEQLKQFWIEKHFCNPIGKSLIFGIFIDNELVGMNAYLPSIYQHNNNEVLCVQSCESCVSPDYQGRGIWGKIVKYAVDYIFTNTKYEVIFGFPNYRNSYIGFVKMGWTTVENMNNYIYINKPTSFVKTFINKSFVKLVSFPLYLQRVALLFYKRSDIDVVECAIDDLLWPQYDNIVCNNPTNQYVKWKMSYKKQKALSIKRKGLVIATCVYEVSSFKGQEVIILDNINLASTANEKYETILSNILAYMYRVHKNAAFIRVWVPNSSMRNKSYKKLLFIKSSHPNPFIIKTNKKDFYKSWDLSFYDLD